MPSARSMDRLEKRMLVKRGFSSIVGHPKTWAVVTATATHLAGAVALVVAEFGTPAVLIVPLLGWLLTVGFPTTLAVVLTASAWGVVPGLWGFWSFLVVAALASYGLEILFFVQLSRFLRRVGSRKEGP